MRPDSLTTTHRLLSLAQQIAVNDAAEIRAIAAVVQVRSAHAEPATFAGCRARPSRCPFSPATRARSSSAPPDAAGHGVTGASARCVPRAASASAASERLASACESFKFSQCWTGQSHGDIRAGLRTGHWKWCTGMVYDMTALAARRRSPRALKQGSASVAGQGGRRVARRAAKTAREPAQAVSDAVRRQRPGGAQAWRRPRDGCGAAPALPAPGQLCAPPAVVVV